MPAKINTVLKKVHIYITIQKFGDFFMLLKEMNTLFLQVCI